MLSVNRIHTYYGRSHVLQGVSLRVGQGEVAALLGRNGAGKSTTINSVMGFTPPRQGQIHLLGREITGRPAHHIARLGVGLVPQGRRIFPTLTVRQNLTLAARHTPTGPWTLERVLELFPPLAGRLNQQGGRLSGGEQQMLALGRALLTNPRLLLLDEPSEGLAPKLVAEIRQVITNLRGQGMSILLVEQNLPLALAVAGRVYVLNKGRIVFEGAPNTLRRRPEIMARYLGV